MEQRRAIWPPVPALKARHLQNCKVLEDRDVMLEYMPQGAVCAELGIYLCDYSEKILRTTNPSKLHLIDNDQEAIRIARDRFRDEISSGIVEVCYGDTGDVVSSMPASYFDWIYIDAAHHYEGVKRDLDSSLPKLKPEALIAMNDYVFFGPSDFFKFGVMEAANQFCIKNDFELIYYALQGRGYNDIVLRKIQQ